MKGAGRPVPTPRRTVGWLGVGMSLVAVLFSGCGPRRLELPTDAGAPLPDFAQVHRQVSSACAGVRTLTAELALSGRAGEQSLRGRVIAGFERPASMHLTGLVPFGAPAFVLVARGGAATLVLPRDDRVVKGEPEEILGALTGVTLAPADLQAVLTGCVMPAPRPTAGRLHGNGMASIDLDGGATLYLRRDRGAWRVGAARRDGWQIEYSEWPGAFPAAVRLQSSQAQRSDVDVTATMSQLEANIDLPADAFAVEVPATAIPLTIEELRDAGPLRAQQ